ncbi:unnamed protein product [Amoebophrya sp. A120]|nr:unnamed protein product [Amoebophrya sp. A120]|eukprot:GSA120T00008757001.1
MTWNRPARSPGLPGRKFARRSTTEGHSSTFSKMSFVASSIGTAAPARFIFSLLLSTPFISSPQHFLVSGARPNVLLRDPVARDLQHGEHGQMRPGDVEDFHSDDDVAKIEQHEDHRRRDDFWLPKVKEAAPYKLTHPDGTTRLFSPSLIVKTIGDNKLAEFSYEQWQQFDSVEALKRAVLGWKFVDQGDQKPAGDVENKGEKKNSTTGRSQHLQADAEGARDVSSSSDSRWEPSGKDTALQPVSTSASSSSSSAAPAREQPHQDQGPTSVRKNKSKQLRGAPRRLYDSNPNFLKLLLPKPKEEDPNPKKQQAVPKTAKKMSSPGIAAALFLRSELKGRETDQDRKYLSSWLQASEAVLEKRNFVLESTLQLEEEVMKLVVKKELEYEKMKATPRRVFNRRVASNGGASTSEPSTTTSAGGVQEQQHESGAANPNPWSATDQSPRPSSSEVREAPVLARKKEREKPEPTFISLTAVRLMKPPLYLLVDNDLGMQNVETVLGETLLKKMLSAIQDDLLASAIEDLAMVSPSSNGSFFGDAGAAAENGAEQQDEAAQDRAALALILRLREQELWTPLERQRNTPATMGYLEVPADTVEDSLLLHLLEQKLGLVLNAADYAEPREHVFSDEHVGGRANSNVLVFSPPPLEKYPFGEGKARTSGGGEDGSVSHYGPPASPGGSTSGARAGLQPGAPAPEAAGTANHAVLDTTSTLSPGAENPKDEASVPSTWPSLPIQLHGWETKIIKTNASSQSHTFRYSNPSDAINSPISVASFPALQLESNWIQVVQDFLTEPVRSRNGRARSNPRYVRFWVEDVLVVDEEPTATTVSSPSRSKIVFLEVSHHYQYPDHHLYLGTYPSVSVRFVFWFELEMKLKNPCSASIITSTAASSVLHNNSTSTMLERELQKRVREAKLQLSSLEVTFSQDFQPHPIQEASNAVKVEFKVPEGFGPPETVAAVHSDAGASRT